MEHIQNLKHLPWISDLKNISSYFQEYNQVLDTANGMKPHNEQFTYKDSVRDFFHISDELVGHPLTNKMNQDEEIFSTDKMEKDCDINLLTCENELPPRELCLEGPLRESGRITNWYAGAYMDGVIPDEGPTKLATLGAQAKELYKRETVADYVRLRHRLLKYSQTMRMVMKKDNQPEEVHLQEDLSSTCLRDSIFNVRIHRPFHKRSYALKGVSRFPRHSQELLMLGSQRLSDLRDALVCINDNYVHKDMSDNPDLSLLPHSNLFSEGKGYKIHINQLDDSKKIFPSSFFYFHGVCYPDLRSPNNSDLCENVRLWATKYPKLGEIKKIKMEDSKFSDLNIRLGYPYLFQHLGNCEHLIVISDVRLMNRTDIQDISRYPLARGNPMKMSIKCCACNLFLAKWLVKDCPRLPVNFAHMCHKCLKDFSYNAQGEKLSDFKLYPFVDEFAAQIINDTKSSFAPKVVEFQLTEDVPLKVEEERVQGPDLEEENEDDEEYYPMSDLYSEEEEI